MLRGDVPLARFRVPSMQIVSANSYLYRPGPEPQRPAERAPDRVREGELQPRAERAELLRNPATVAAAVAAEPEWDEELGHRARQALSAYWQTGQGAGQPGEDPGTGVDLYV